MFRISKTLVGILQTVPILLGLAAMCASVYIRDCQKVLQYPLFFVGLFMFIFSTLGLVSTLCRLNAALYLYLLLTFFLILAFSSFTILALFVTTDNTRHHHASPVRYAVADFSPWLQHYVTDARNWNRSRSCLLQKRVCHNLTGDANNNSLVFNQFSTIQFGCCKPPAGCGFKMKNATLWEEGRAGGAVNDSDCETWNNREEKLCYDCNSCKGGVLANIRKQWRHLTICNVCVLVLVTVIYLLTCYAIRNNRLGYTTYRRDKVIMRTPL